MIATLYRTHAAVCAFCAVYGLFFGEVFISLSFGAVAIWSDMFVADAILTDRWREKEWNGLQNLIQYQFEEIKRLREVLKPFAEYGEFVDRMYPEHGDDFLCAEFGPNEISFGNFRVAHSTLQQKDDSND